MRAGVALASCAAAAMAGAALVSCFDLFHGTGDVLTACEIDSSADGCSAGTAHVEAGAPEGGTDFCAWSDTTAQHNAQRACAWLGACETPLGRNAFGTCMFDALLAYDCRANPSHPVKGEAHALWDCLWQAASCADVDACVFPAGRQPCGTSGTACGTAATDGGTNLDVRVECVDGGPWTHGENCALWGQTCASIGKGGTCAGAPGTAGLDCDAAPTCAGSSIHYCTGGVDDGLDCAGNGAQACGGFPASAVRWLACLPATDAGACAPDASASCDGGVATSCPAGVLETLDCNALLGTDQGCTPGALPQPYADWTSPCSVDSPDAACVEGCVDGTITGCARGTSYSVACLSVGLSDCAMVTTDNGQATHAACTP